MDAWLIERFHRPPDELDECDWPRLMRAFEADSLRGAHDAVERWRDGHLSNEQIDKIVDDRLFKELLLGGC